jgi:hypothetical protein
MDLNRGTNHLEGYEGTKALSIGVGARAGRRAPNRQADGLVVRGESTREITALANMLDI